ncbi:MAG: sigma-54-dependent Fis family transcriptional regulator [Candidatus Omnitrophica bacterium]|nr:sigma-54-dependent Fis family transcriptional regulator [Candidatus Omnitrophota bacterium]
MPLFATILIVDDEKNTRDGLKQFLEAKGYDILLAADGSEGWEIYLKDKPDLVLCDVKMPKMDGIVLLEKIIAHDSKATVIFLTAYGSVEDAVKAMKKGAYYYLTKPINLEELDFLVTKSLAKKNLEEENQELRQALFTQKFERGEILAVSPKMKEALRTVDKIAKSNSAVLIEGESGTGKELIAHRIHRLSSRASKPFIAVHCAALTETLLASELFGHERGAFTGASERKIGRFERAHQGTLFLDEVGEISAETQVKLLRVLQNGEFERVGGSKTIRVDVRLVCATNKNLKEEVNKGRFREDLYYRINVIYIKLPSLRERPEDILPLIDYFIKYFSEINGKKPPTLAPDAKQALLQYPWPGNIRELKNIIERMVVLSNEHHLHLANVPDDIRNNSGQILSSSTTESLLNGSRNLSDVEKEFIKQALNDSRGNKSSAAKKLGISRRTLYRKIDEYKL